MTTIVGAAGGGIWSAGGSWVGGVAPTAADDVQLTAASGNITTTGGTAGFCRSLDCTGYTGTLTGSVALNIGDATAGAGNIALKLVAGMGYTHTGGVNFVSTSATQQTIDTAGKTIGGNAVFNGLGGSWKLLSPLTAVGNLTATAGALDLDNNNVTVGSVLTTGALTRSLTLGTATLTLSSTWTVSGSGYTVSAASSTIVHSGATFTGAGLTYGAVSFLTAATLTLNDTNTFASLTRTGTAVTTAAFTLSADQTVTGAFTVTGDSAINRMLMQSSVVGTARTVTAGSVSLSYVDVADVTGAGASAPWTGTSLGDCLGNSGITFDTPTTQTHTASAGGNWSDVTKWTSRIPLPQDTVIVDVNTTGTLTANTPRLGADITFTGFAGTMSFSVISSAMFGSLTLGTGTTVSGTSVLSLKGRSSKTITSNGKTCTMGVTIVAPGGTYTLADAFNTASTLNLTAGTFTTANFAVTCQTYLQSGAAVSVLNLGSSAVTVNGLTTTTVWGVGASGTGGTVNAGTSQIVLATTATGFRLFAGGSQTYATLTYTVAGSTGALNITGSNTFDTINFSDATNARNLNFAASTTTTVGTFNVNGTAGKLMGIISSSAGTQATLVKSGGGTVSCNYLSVKDSAATPANTWSPGANSTNVSNNTGWVGWPTDTDPVVLSDAEALAAMSTDADVASFVEAEFVAVSESDTATLADTESVAVDLVDVDTATVTDDGSPTAVVVDGEVASLVDADTATSLMLADADVGGFAEFDSVEQFDILITDTDMVAVAEAESLSVVGLSGADTFTATDAESLTVVNDASLSDGDTAQFVEAEFLDAVWLFSPPTVEEGGQFGTHPLFGRYRLTQGVTVAVAGSTVFELTHPYQGDLDEFDRVYRGGYVHEISGDEAAMLTAAGYGPNIL